MKNLDLLSELAARGLLSQTSDPAALSKHLAQGPIGVYCGFDPTADSLHVGHLLLLTLLKRFLHSGHRIVLLIGGGTSQVGDPSFKLRERTLNPLHELACWGEKIDQQVQRLMGVQETGHSALKLVNNAQWLSALPLLEFLREVGKLFSVNTMIHREAVARRLQRDDHGLSFAEFSYALLQAYDFLKLYELYGTSLQIGGSDQWGNMVGGLHLIHRKHPGSQVHVLTVPLLLQNNGEKFGKTEAGAVWLDPEKTSPYGFYQFWYRIPDDAVVPTLKRFTFLPLEEIENLERAYLEGTVAPQTLQTLLAQHMTEQVHGQEAVNRVQKLIRVLFQPIVGEELTQQQLEELARGGIPTVTVPWEKAEDLRYLLVASGLAESRSQAKALIHSASIWINFCPSHAEELCVSSSAYRYQRYLLLRKGKKEYALVCRTSQASGSAGHE